MQAGDRQTDTDTAQLFDAPLLPYEYSYPIRHPVTDRAKPSFVIFDIRALLRSALSVGVPGYQKLQMTA